MSILAELAAGRGLLVVTKKLSPVEFAHRYCSIPFLLPANGIFDSFVFRALVQMQMEPITVVFICHRHFVQEQIRAQV